MNQSSGGSGIAEGEGDHEALEGASPPPRCEAARGVVVLPQSACMSAFQAAWVSDHGGEGGSRGEGESVKARWRGRSKAKAVVAVPVVNEQQGGRGEG